MAILRFRIYFEEDETVYRDIAVKHKQSFLELHQSILKAYEFDSKHAATFYRSNDHWQQGREISFEVYDKAYKAPPLLMADTVIATEIKSPNQRFVYQYDFVKGWTFLVELINVSNEADPNLDYPALVRSVGLAPSQYGTKSMLGEKFADIEEKYDLTHAGDGFGEKDEEGEDVASEEESFGTEEEE
jgi:hypothetical protein